MVKKCGLACLVVCLLVGRLVAQELPEDELQVNVSGYFDSFNVNVIYPSISLTRQVSETTSLTGRYLVDMVTAASIRSNADSEDQPVDGVTSASSRGGTTLPSFDDVRHELGLGVTQLIAGRTVSLNGIYSRENDYGSATLAGTMTQSFAKKNTTVQVGFVRSWDKIFPANQDWTRDKNVTTLSASVSQILGKRLIAQVLYSYNDYAGYLSDGYQYVTIAGARYDPVLPENRVRQAAAARLNYRLDRASSLQLGYRYYWDTWEVASHTFSGLYQRHLSPAVTAALGIRSYFQSSAFFFKPEYLEPETYMTVDNKLDATSSNEVQFTLTLDGGKGRDYLPFLKDERVQYTFSLNLYLRHTDAPDWFSGTNNLFAGYSNVGVRYRF